MFLVFFLKCCHGKFLLLLLLLLMLIFADAAITHTDKSLLVFLSLCVYVSLFFPTYKLCIFESDASFFVLYSINSVWVRLVSIFFLFCFVFDFQNLFLNFFCSLDQCTCVCMCVCDDNVLCLTATNCYTNNIDFHF